MHDIPGRSYIYVVGPDIGPKKIGYAKDFSRRLSSYKTNNVQNVRVLFAQNCPEDTAKAIENEVHKAFADKRSHGEWFDVTAEDATAAVKASMQKHKQPFINFRIYIDDYDSGSVYFGGRGNHHTWGQIMFNLLDWPRPNNYGDKGLTVALLHIGHKDNARLNTYPDRLYLDFELARIAQMIM